MNTPLTPAPAQRRPTPGAPATPSVGYPDDLVQNREDRHRPPALQPGAQTQVRDHACQHQGGGPTGAHGGDRPASNFDSALSPIAGRDVIPGPHPDARGEAHWDAPLPVLLRAKGVEGLELRTLRDAGDFLSGRYATLEHSAALQDTALAAIAAARSGAPEDVAEAARRLQAYLAAMGML